MMRGRVRAILSTAYTAAWLCFVYSQNTAELRATVARQSAFKADELGEARPEAFSMGLQNRPGRYPTAAKTSQIPSTTSETSYMYRC